MLVAFSSAQLIPVNLTHDGVKSLGWRHSTYCLWRHRKDNMSGKILFYFWKLELVSLSNPNWSNFFKLWKKVWLFDRTISKFSIKWFKWRWNYVLLSISNVFNTYIKFLTFYEVKKKELKCHQKVFNFILSRLR